MPDLSKKDVHTEGFGSPSPANPQALAGGVLGNTLHPSSPEAPASSGHTGAPHISIPSQHKHGRTVSHLSWKPRQDFFSKILMTTN